MGVGLVWHDGGINVKVLDLYKADVICSEHAASPACYDHQHLGLQRA